MLKKYLVPNIFHIEFIIYIRKFAIVRILELRNVSNNWHM